MSEHHIPAGDKSRPRLRLRVAGLCLGDDAGERVPEVPVCAQHTAPHDVERPPRRVPQLHSAIGNCNATVDSGMTL